MARERIAGVELRRLVSNGAYVGGFGRRHWGTVLRFCWKLWGAQGEIRGFDAVVFGKWPLLPALVVPMPAGPTIAFDWCELRSGLHWRWVYRRLAKRRRWVHLAIHAGIRAWLTERGVPRDRIQVIGSAAPAAGGQGSRTDRSILFLGRLSEHKQPLKLLKAFESARLSALGYTLHFAGGGPLAGALAEAARHNAGVTLHGRVSDQEKHRLLSSCSLLALPSLREGFPVVVAEACAVGTPCLTVAAPDNGAAWVVEELQCGWVVEDAVDALGQGMAGHADMSSADWQLRSAKALARSADTLDIRTQAQLLAKTLATSP